MKCGKEYGILLRLIPLPLPRKSSAYKESTPYFFQEFV